MYFLFQIVLAACSNFFANIFSANNGEKSQQSLIVLEDIRALDFKHLLQFMYHGQVDIDRFGNMGCQVSKITMWLSNDVLTEIVRRPHFFQRPPTTPRGESPGGIRPISAGTSFLGHTVDLLVAKNQYA